MTWLKAYDWERERFPLERRIEIRPRLRVGLVRALCAQFGLALSVVNLNMRGGGLALGGYRIDLPRYDRPCSLGTIFHEVAHILNGQKYGGHGHTGTFRKALVKVYVEGRQGLRDTLRRVHQEAKAQEAKMAGLAQAAERLAAYERAESLERRAGAVPC